MAVPHPGRVPDADAIADAARRSPLRERALTVHADLDELRYREEIETFPDPGDSVVHNLEKKELLRKLTDALQRTGVVPRGVVVEFGAGTAWLSAALARFPDVERVIAVEFSRRRLVELAPAAIAYLGAPPEKVERVVADFYDPGIDEGTVDLLVMDAAFHHAADPQLLADHIAALLRRGGQLLLFREPTLSWFVRDRGTTVEDEHGDFEHGYTWRGYTGFLERAGLVASKVPATHSYTVLRARVRLHPPLSWLNGTVFSTFTYHGRKP